MSAHNDLLRSARQRVPSPTVPGECLSRAELAEAVNAWLWERTERRYELDDHLIGKWERGRVRCPIAPYRAALRAVLGVASDAALGFEPAPRRSRVATPVPAAGDGRWARAQIVEDGTTATEWDLLNRRDTLRGAAAIGGAALLNPLAGWLDPLLDPGLSERRGPLSTTEVEAVERVVDAFRGWRSPASGLGRTAVVGQLHDVAERLRGAPSDALTDRMFLAGAELARIAGSMAFDEGQHGIAQRHYVTAVRMAKAAGETSFGAVALAALARQSFDLGAADDGLEIVLLAQRGSRHRATPGLRSLLATREAWGHAQRGELYAFRRAVDVAEQAHADVAPGAEPRWLAGHDAAELAGTIGARYRDLARHDVRQAGRAVEYLGRALELRDPGRVRNRVFDLVALGRAQLLTGEADRSARTVASALPLLTGQRQGRVARKLGDWRAEAAPFLSVPAVRETCTTITEAAAARPL